MSIWGLINVAYLENEIFKSTVTFKLYIYKYRIVYDHNTANHFVINEEFPLFSQHPYNQRILCFTIPFLNYSNGFKVNLYENIIELTIQIWWRRINLFLSWILSSDPISGLCPTMEEEGQQVYEKILLIEFNWFSEFILYYLLLTWKKK